MATEGKCTLHHIKGGGNDNDDQLFEYDIVEHYQYHHIGDENLHDSPQNNPTTSVEPCPQWNV